MMALKGLAKLGEECNEVGQIVCKAMQVGGLDAEHWSGDLREMLIQELGDLLAAAEFAINRNGLHRTKVLKQRAKKLALFNEWDKE